ncbi:CD209 antigen-like protein E isoform X1 [Thunnus maccoyii]|uniref:CD209 antigen-like protein E isoform X1 n=1 Tax=Thunnus maccoyii TaxID=8240 RepID=UPI001C4A8B45|nr:CD209 antigen-like protein E isoform X1 [Thunnus maccoyii]
MMSHTEGEALDSQQHAVSKGGSKVTSERVALLVLSALLVVALIVIYRVSMVNMQTKESLQMLKTKYKEVQRHLNETLSRKVVPPSCPQPPEIKPSDSCLKCDKDWLQFGGKCYYFSTTTSSWEESRRYCQSQGGDLVKIDSWDEQTFLTKELSDKMNYYEDMFWIGLTDSKEEGKWFWVDDSPLNTSLSFWREHEPDNWGRENHEGEDCVRMGEKGRPAELNCWSDKSCDEPQRIICEKQAEKGFSRVMCF